MTQIQREDFKARKIVKTSLIIGYGEMHASTYGKMKYDTDWDNGSTSYDPLHIIALINKTVLAQTEDQYTFATVYEQECSIYSFIQNTLSNEQWYERFNIKLDAGSAIGVTQQHQVLLYHFT